MKKMKFGAVVMAALIILSGCGMSNTAKGGLIGGGAGAGIGALVGNLIGRNHWQVPLSVPQLELVLVC